jgi:hypothetical protein
LKIASAVAWIDADDMLGSKTVTLAPRLPPPGSVGPVGGVVVGGVVGVPPKTLNSHSE